MEVFIVCFKSLDAAVILATWKSTGSFLSLSDLTTVLVILFLLQGGADLHNASKLNYAEACEFY